MCGFPAAFGQHPGGERGHGEQRAVKCYCARADLAYLHQNGRKGNDEDTDRQCGDTEAGGWGEAHALLYVLLDGYNKTFRKDEWSRDMNEQTRIEVEAAAFRGLTEYLRKRTDVQNIDLMNLAGFCRNCLAKWYLAAAKERGVDLDYEQAREVVYGMKYSEWKDNHQTETPPEALEKFKAESDKHAF